MAEKKKPNDKLSKIDKRSASVAQGKKYSDMTPAEKRKWNANQSRYDAELTKQRKTATKSSPKTIKAAVKKTVKRTAKERGFEKDKASRKEMKQQDVFYNKAGKADLKEGYRSGAASANTPKSKSPSKPKVPVKPRGGAGMRGGRGGMGFGGGMGGFGGGSGLRGSVNK